MKLLQKQSLELRAKTNPAELITLDNLLEEKPMSLNGIEIDFVLENYSKFLTYDFKRSLNPVTMKELKRTSA